MDRTKYIKQNIKAFDDMYANDWGNKYPTDGLVSYYHNIIKPNLCSTQNIKVLDFGCSLGANTKFFADLGFDVYGIDSSVNAIKRCIYINKFEPSHFKCCNILEKGNEINNLFDIKFDLIVALNVLPYFSNNDLKLVLEQFCQVMSLGAIFYSNMYTMRREWKVGERIDDMYLAEQSGSVGLDTYLNLVEDKNDTEQLFSTFFSTIAVTHTIVEGIDGENESIHYFGKK